MTGGWRREGDRQLASSRRQAQVVGGGDMQQAEAEGGGADLQEVEVAAGGAAAAAAGGVAAAAAGGVAAAAAGRRRLLV